MAEDLKNLIEKIREEGIKAAEDKARAIEGKAKKLADNIVQDARHKADDIIKRGEEEAKKTEESGYASLKQAGRDIMISLRKEINSMLSKITAGRMREALTPAEMAKVISAIIKEGPKTSKEGVIISANSKDIEKLEKSLMAELGDEIKQGITLKRSDEITGGFIISYDSGKSYFDFTDKSLAAHISFRMNQKLKELLNV
ncbi:MAG: hypothetical protein KKD29_01705 [Candidatus Omnitrophica bacterium]|nr:hypothetical protein [Candidatus Omnitrophota bacterium]MBU4488406.1 hypothetical protein [Candidatus Omnitrophota bacterium]MCG2705002.1 hypothetical protein [Candidatus Omnitrophota bacterium]